MFFPHLLGVFDIINPPFFTGLGRAINGFHPQQASQAAQHRAGPGGGLVALPRSGENIEKNQGKSPCFLGKSLCFIMFIYFQKGHLHHSKVSSNNQRVTLGELAAGTIWISARDVERSLPAWEEEIHILRLLDSTGEDNLGPIKGPMATRIFFGSPKTILTSKCPEIWQK
jgi:hypothetical protein